MAYIGRGIDNISNASLLDDITFTNSAGPYNLTQSSAAFTPISAQALVISVDGVIQDPSSYTISGSTITFGTSMASTLTNDFIVHNGVGIVNTPADDSVTTAKIENLAVTTAKIDSLAVTNAKIAAGTIDVTSKITGVVPTANLGSGTASSSTYLAGDQTYQTITEYDDSVVQSNIAMLGFKVAVNGSLTRYNLVDQTIDEFFDTSGVDASASSNEVRSGVSPYYYFGGSSAPPTENADSSTVDGSDTYLKWTTVTASGSVNFGSTLSVEYLVVGGGGSGAYGNAGGGGAGGYLANDSKALELTGGNTYTVVVGAGATAPSTSSIGANGDSSSLSGTGISTITSYGGGGGGNGSIAPPTGTFGSGGGSGYNNATAGVGTSGQGYDGGGAVTSSPRHGASGGGGASEVGANGTNSNGGDGGDGVANDITGASVYYAGGGGGSTDNTTSASGAGGNGGGGPGASTDNSVDTYSDGAANTGGGGGGAYYSGSGHTRGGNGGSGIVVIRYLTADAVAEGADLTLQSTDVTADATPSYGEFVTLIENNEGTAVLNTDIKGYISRDSGVTFTQGTLADEGSWGTNKQILGFHDLDISAQPSGTSMCYKITTHNQSAGSKETRIYATSIGWR